MPSREMQDVIDALRDGQKASAGRAPAALEQRRHVAREMIWPIRLLKREASHCLNDGRSP